MKVSKQRSSRSTLDTQHSTRNAPLPPALASCLERADAAFQAGERERARDLLKEALRLSPDVPEILASLGSIEFQLGNLKPAAAALARAVELQPANASVLTRLAIVYLQQNQAGQFEAALQKALEIDPDQVDALLLLANLNRDLQRYPEAVKLYSRVLQLQPPDANLLLALSNCYYGLGDLESAKALCELVLQLEPENSIAKDNLAILQSKAASPQPAVQSEASSHSTLNTQHSTPSLPYLVSIANEGPDATYELSVDIYPENNPQHPQRHYGHWNKLIPLKSGQSLSVKVLWAPQTKNVSFDNHPADLFWRGDFTEPGPYRVGFVLYKDKKPVQFKYHQVTLGDKLATGQEIPVRFFVGKESQLRNAIWFLTWACTYKCPYCWEVQRQLKGEFKPEPFLPAEKWVEAWNRLRPAVLDLTGGEPFLQPGFLDMLQNFHQSIRVAITTNIHQDLTQFVQKISPEKVFSMTLSFHPTQKQTFDTFLGKCLLLKNRGFNLTVNFVTWPEQMWLLPYYKDVFEKNGLRFHVDPYAATPHAPYQLSERELAFLKQHVGADRARAVGIGIEKVPVLCSAGYDHLSVQPNGDAYRCIHDKINNVEKVGNLFDPSFQLYPEWKFCADFHVCPNCDRDQIKVKKLPAESQRDSGAKDSSPSVRAPRKSRKKSAHPEAVPEA